MRANVTGFKAVRPFPNTLAPFTYVPPLTIMFWTLKDGDTFAYFYGPALPDGIDVLWTARVNKDTVTFDPLPQPWGGVAYNFSVRPNLYSKTGPL